MAWSTRTKIAFIIFLSYSTNIDQIYPIFLLLAEIFVMKVVLNFITFGVKVPGGIFIPTMVAGAVFGRMVGLGVQWLIV